MGVVTLNGSSGVTVSTNKVTANSRIFLTIQSPGGTVGSPYINARVPGGNFTIKSVAGDTSLCAWEIREPS
jgi:hypothetical protein